MSYLHLFILTTLHRVNACYGAVGVSRVEGSHRPCLQLWSSRAVFTTTDLWSHTSMFAPMLWTVPTAEFHRIMQSAMRIILKHTFQPSKLCATDNLTTMWMERSYLRTVWSCVLTGPAQKQLLWHRGWKQALEMLWLKSLSRHHFFFFGVHS